MSKPYRIKLQETIAVVDASTFQIDPVPLVTEQDFSHIVEETLRELGWEAASDGRMEIKVNDQETWTFDPTTMQIVTEVKDQKHLNQDIEGWDNEDLQGEAEKVKNQQQHSLQSRLTQKLEEGQTERKQQFENIVAEATGRAIKEAAQKLGDVQEINEERGPNGEYTLSITIHDHD